MLEEVQLAPQQPVNLFANALDSADAATPTDDKHPLLTHMGFAPVSLDALQARCGIDTATLQAELLALELDGLVGRLPGGLFQRLATA